MEKKTMYVVVRYEKPRNIMEFTYIHIYSKQSSNKEKMMEYAKEQKARHENAFCKVGLMTRENAKKFIAEMRRREEEDRKQRFSEMEKICKSTIETQTIRNAFRG